jgi:deoxyribose-phosphate aldolase
MTDPIALLDLTSLNDDDTAETVRALCAKALTARGPVAAVCILPAFIGVARKELAGTGVKVATVANFPEGDDDPFGAADQVQFAIDAGADEVDVVAPWRAHLDGDLEAAATLVAACAAAAPAGALKVILETGSHPGAAETRALADAALANGAAFVKTSTGKTGPGASPQAARVLCEAVRDFGSGGVKVSGGVRTAEQADAYVALAEEILGAGWATPDTLRIGASSLLDELLARR